MNLQELGAGLFPFGIRAFQTCRTGGCSPEPWDSFNLALHVGDAAERVQANRKILQKRLSEICGHTVDLVWMHQTHSIKVVNVKNRGINPQGYEADGLITNESRLALCVMTADCLPLLLCSQDGQAVAAVHCGWRGLLGGIAQNAVRQLRAMTDATILAAMGAAIGPESFEVGSEVRSAFVSLHAEAALAFKPAAAADKYLANLYLLCRQALIRAGLKPEHIQDLKADTFTQSDRYFSYRKSKVTGRMASVIVIN